MVLLGFLAPAAVTRVTRQPDTQSSTKGASSPGNCCLLLLENQYLNIMHDDVKLILFYNKYSSSQTVHSKSKHHFQMQISPVFVLRYQEQHICNQLCITFIFLPWTAPFFSCCFISHSILDSMFDCKAQAYTTYPCLLQPLLLFQPFPHFGAVVSHTAFAVAQSRTHRACRHPRRHPCTGAQPAPASQQTLWLPLKGLRAEWEALLMLLTYNQFSLHYFIT